ncbi:MAG: AarF/UbiB family protein [Acidobacteriota bacterium]|nr:AarF/UbiB family protein [Acidobacteriota bacterium]
MTAHPMHLPKFIRIAWILWKHGRNGLFDQMEPPMEFPPELSGQAAEHGDEAGKPEELADELEELGPTFVKLGQLLSTRPDLIPPDYLKALARLQDGVDPVPFDEIREILQEELGARPSKIFRTIEEEPMASASLAQVHRAVLRDGTRVALKVQRPGLRKRVVDDIQVLESAAELFAARCKTFDLEEVVGDLTRTLLQELDFQREAENLLRMDDTLAEYPRLVVPRPITGLSTSKLLTMELIHGTKVTDVNPVVLIDLDGEELAEQLFRGYLEQVLVQGFVHVDPHPGNLLLTADHRIALLDLGMVLELGQRMRELLLQLMLSISEGDGEQTTQLALRLGEETDELDVDALRAEISALVQRLTDHQIEELQLGILLMEVSQVAARNGLRLPREFPLLGKTLLNLDQVAILLAPNFQPNRTIQEEAARIAQDQMNAAWSPSALFSKLMSLRDTLERVPRAVDRVLETVEETGGVRLDVQAFDEERLLAGLQKIANRITAGLVLAALILGAALLMQVPSDLQLFGYPAFAIILFLGAVIGGCVLVWNIFRSDIQSN